MLTACFQRAVEKRVYVVVPYIGGDPNKDPATMSESILIFDIRTPKTVPQFWESAMRECAECTYLFTAQEAPRRNLRWVCGNVKSLNTKPLTPNPKP